MKKYLSIAILVIFAGCAHSAPQKDLIFQNAPINALMAGVYDGTMTIGEVRERGDFGLGTLNALDGELVVLNGAFYQVKSDGKVYLLADDAETPFAAVTFFETDQAFSSDEALDFEGLKELIDGEITSPNLPYAIKVTGEFKTIKVRSPVRQEEPYPDLTEAIKTQKIFELEDQTGTLVGFRTPSYMAGVNVPGYHFHFLNQGRTAGGHVLGLQLTKASVELDEGDGFLMELPKNKEFLKFRFEDDPGKALAKIEK